MRQNLLNVESIRAAMQRAGLNQSDLSGRLGVSRAAVSKWFKQDDFPRPDKLLKLALLLKLDFNSLVEERESAGEPVIAFRKKGNRKTTDAHTERARRMGRLLSRLVPLLPFDSFVRPATLQAPACDYGYLQAVTMAIRAKLSIAEDAVVRARDLVGHFTSLRAILVPVLWGHKDHHENALHIYLPDSMTTWVYLNLDSTIHDFKFWMAHELGHVYAPDLRGDMAEDFADAFAQALLFPAPCAARAYEVLAAKRDVGTRVNAMKEIAGQYGISPVTIQRAVQDYTKHHGLPAVDVGASIHAATTDFNKAAGSVSETLFMTRPPTPQQYLEVAQSAFESPFFGALQRLIREQDASVGYVEEVLQMPLLDARSIVDELR